MNENEIFRLKGRIAISNLSREDKDMINSILDGINKKDEDEKGYLYTVRVKLNNGSLAHATLFFKSETGPTFEDLKKELDDMGIKDDDYSDSGIIIINRIVMSGEEFDRFVKKDYSFKDDIVPGGAMVELAKEVYNVDVMAVIYYKGKQFSIPLDLLEPVSSKKDNNKKEGESVKNDIIDDKLRWDLLPMEEIEDIVKVYHAGAKKYGPNNWQNLDNGFERYRAAMFRHLMEYMKGERVDSDTGCFHLAQCAWNCIAMLWYDKHGKGLIPLNKEEKK